MVSQISIYGFIAVAFIAVVNAQTQVQTTSSPVEVKEGATAQFECHVLNLQSNQQVVWHFVDHNVTISTGDVITAGNSFDKKYSIYRPQDEGGSNYWNLAISNVESSDMGTYQCYVKGSQPLAKVTHHLEVVGLPPKEQAPHFNVTDCCTREGVEACALPLCDTSTPLTEVLMVANGGVCMENNLIKVLTCGQDGRNHLGCCMRSGMSDLCLELCDGHGEADGTDYTSCIGIPTISLVECLKEGQFLLPSQPTAVSAINLGEEILVSWQPPEDNVDLVTGYKVQYRKAGDITFISESAVSKSSYTKVLTGLDLYTIYEVRVIAVASAGASQPSYTVVIATGAVVSKSDRNDTIADCCMKTNVSAECQSYCSADMIFIGGNSASLLSCHSQLNTISQCLAGYGNHTPCCERVQVPENCYRLCQGEVYLSWDIVSCLTYMPLISACMIEGSAILPYPPKNTHIEDGSVTSDSAVIAWDKSDSSQEGEWFVVSWKLHYSDLPTWTSVRVVAGTSYQITNLKPLTVYNVIVSTVNDKGSSLPELTLMLVTEGVSSDIPFNETVCCSEQGVSSECLNLCKHEFRITDNMTLILELGLRCPDALGPMLLCATDGRNHTDCCGRKGIQGNCLSLCSLNHDSTPSTEFLSCISYRKQLTECFDEGKKVKPRVPLEVSVKALDVYSITIDWLSPIGPNVTQFIVQYSLDMKYWMTGTNVTQTFAAVKGLKPDTIYYFRVLSVNNNGQSLPSTVVRAYTLPVPINGTHERNWLMLWSSKQDCCANSSNTTVCQKGCTSGKDIDLVQCAEDMDKIVACGADGRDHTECCTRYPNFPEVCLPYCRGQPGPRDVQSALCLHYVGAMFACFVEGEGVIPSAPQSLKAAAISSTSLEMKWLAPADNCDDGCFYVAMLWTDESQSLKYKKDTNETSYTFTDLDPETQYRVSVTARNNFGTSLPSPYVILLTPSDGLGSVLVSQYPPGVANPFDDVQLECWAVGAELASVKWVRNKKTIGEDNLYKISKVSKEDDGLYSCVVTFVDNSVQTKDWFLNVRFTPHPVKMNKADVLPGVRLDSDIECVFTGHPDIVTWTKDSHALQGGSKYIFPTLVTDFDNGKTTSILRVKHIVSNDFGSYTCNATNKYGSNSITGKLENTFPGTGLPPSVPPTEGKVRECCQSKNVPDICAQHICTYAIDINAILSDPNLSYCLLYLEDFFFCGSDGKNHSKCCTEGGVAEFCLPMCAGRLPDSSASAELLLCMPHAETMLNCAINAQQYIPAAPQNVRANLLYDTVQVLWEFGDNANKVDVYHVWYQSGSKTKNFDGAIRTAKSYKLPSSFVKKGETIKVWVVSHNDFGSSHQSNTASLNITSLVPTMPSRLNADLVDATSIHVKWDSPITSLKIIKYAVFFKKVGGQDKVVNTKYTNTRLDKLLPKTNYVIQVAAVSADGVGQKSKAFHITTGVSDTSVITSDTQGQTGQSSEVVGIVVGLILGALFLAAVIIVAVLLFRRLRVPPPAQRHDTVSFENPQYSNGQRVSGLPGDSEENNSFGYGKLNEEHDNQHDYLTLEPQQTEGSNTPATLNIEA